MSKTVFTFTVNDKKGRGHSVKPCIAHKSKKSYTRKHKHKGDTENEEISN